MSVDPQGKSLTGFGLSYEDVEIGEHFEMPSKDVTAAVIEAFAEMTGDRLVAGTGRPLPGRRLGR